MFAAVLSRKQAFRDVVFLTSLMVLGKLLVPSLHFHLHFKIGLIIAASSVIMRIIIIHIL